MKVILPVLLKIGCHGNVPWGIGKNWSGLTTFTHKYLSFGEKNRENRSSISWDSFAQFKKKKEFTEGKIYSPVGKFAERAKNQNLIPLWMPKS